MIPRLTPYSIALTWATALRADASLKDWSEKQFGRAPLISVGINFRRPPSECDAPFIAIIPEGTGAAESDYSLPHKVGMVLGLRRDGFIRVENLEVMDGLHLVEAFQTHILRVLAALPCYRPVEGQSDIVLEAYPLLQLSLDFTVREQRPIGSRRSL